MISNIESGIQQWPSAADFFETTGISATTTTTTTPAPSGCGIPEWANDIYCDDQNNNPGCNFDGGACCFNNNNGWNNYCTVI